MDDYTALDYLQDWISAYVINHPTNNGEYDPSGRLASIPKHMRAGIIFYSAGWGWRLRKDWKAKLHTLLEGMLR